MVLLMRLAKTEQARNSKFLLDKNSVNNFYCTSKYLSFFANISFPKKLK